MKRFLAKDKMTFKRYLGIELLGAFFVVLANQSFGDKVEIVFYFACFGHQFLFIKLSHFYYRHQVTIKLIICDVNKFAQIVLKKNYILHATNCNVKATKIIDSNQCRWYLY